MAGFSFEKFEIGRAFGRAPGRTLSGHDNASFGLMPTNPQPLHVDAHFAVQTGLAKPLSDSLHAPGILIGSSVPDTTLGTIVGTLGRRVGLMCRQGQP